MTAKLDIVDIAYDRFKPIFDGYDKDHSSTLERPEFQKLLADCLGVEETDISNDQLEWHFSRIDKDGDGKITFDEYVCTVLVRFLTSSEKERRIQRLRIKRKEKEKTSSLTSRSSES